MARLVEHRRQPFLARHDVGQHADVALAVHVLAEGMRALAGLFEKVAAAQHVVDRQADARVELADDLDGVDRPVDGAEVAIDGRRLLEERIVVVPRPQLVNAYAALPGQGCVDLGLGGVERHAGQGIKLVENLQHLFLALFGQSKLHHVEVFEAELPGCAVPQAGQLDQVRCEDRSHGLARLPDRPPPGRVFRGPQNIADLVLGQFLPADFGTVNTVGLFHGVRPGRHLLDQLGVDLPAQILEIEYGDLPGDQRLADWLLLDRFEFSKRLAIGQQQAEPRLDFFLLAKGRIAARRVGFPPAAVGFDLQGANCRLMPGDESPGTRVVVLRCGNRGGYHNHRAGQGGQRRAEIGWESSHKHYHRR